MGVMPLVLYVATAFALLLLCRRFVRPMSLAAAAILTLLPLAFTGDALLRGRAFGPFDHFYDTVPGTGLREAYGVGSPANGVLSDIYSQMIPWRKAVQWAIQHREWPLLNRFILSGDILAAAGQPAVYSPFTLIALLLPVELSFTYTASIAFFVAALSAFLFARELDCREGAALFGGVAWMSTGAITLFILWPLGFAWALFPFLLLAVRRVVIDASIAAAGTLVFAFVLLLFAGHPETALHAVFLAACYGVFLTVRRRRGLIRPLLLATAAGVIALALSAIYLLPLLEAAPQSRDSQYRENMFRHQPRGVSLETTAARLAADALPFLHLRQWRDARVGFIPIDSAAVGSLALAAALFALLRRRDAETWFFAAALLFCLLMRGEWTPLARLMQKLPLFDIAINERFSFGAAAFLSVLAACGVESLLRRGEWRLAAAVFGALLAVIGAATWVIGHSSWLAEPLPPWGTYRVPAELIPLAVVVILLALKPPARVFVPALLGLILAQRVVSEGGAHSSLERRQAYPPIPLLEPLKEAKQPFRIIGHGRSFVPGTAALYELEDPRGYEAMTLAPYVATYDLWSIEQPVWFNRVDDLTRPFLSFLNVRYAITWDKEEPPAGWRMVKEANSARLFENLNVIDRAFVPEVVRLGADEAAEVPEMMAAKDFRRVAWIEANVPTHDRANGPGRVTIKPRKLGWTIHADMDGDGWVVVSQAAWKGWRAYVDDRRVKLQTANHAFLGVFVPKGRHRIKLVYLPDSFVRGRAITFATLAALAVLAIARIASGRRGVRASARTPDTAANEAG